MSKKRIKEFLLSTIIIIGAGSIMVVFFTFYGGGNINKAGRIDVKAFSVYARVCDVPAVAYEHPDSKNFIEKATRFDLFSTSSPKVLVIDSDGSAYSSRNGLGGEWKKRIMKWRLLKRLKRP